MFHEKKAEIIEKEIGVKIPRQTIQYHKFEKSDKFIEKENIYKIKLKREISIHQEDYTMIKNFSQITNKNM